MQYAQRAAPPPGGEPDEFVLSDGSVDRMGDVIEPAGWQLDKLKSDPPVLFNHDRGQVVGRWTERPRQGRQADRQDRLGQIRQVADGAIYPRPGARRAFCARCRSAFSRWRGSP